MSLIRSFVAIVSILTLTTQNVLAVSYPSTGPSGAFSGGSFGTYLQNLITNPCPPGEVVSGFSTGSSNYGEPICAVMNLSSGGATGDTLRYDGSSWVANSVIYNDGINVGIGNVGPASKLDVAGVLTVNPGAFGDAINFYNGYKIRTVGGGGIQIQGSPYVAIGNTSGLNGATFSIGNTGAAMLTLYPDVGQYGLVVSGYDFAVDSEGNLGIGTTSPNTKLEISSTRDNAFRINKTGGTNWSYMEWLYGGTRKYWQGLNALGNYAIESDTSTGQIFISGSRISIGVVNPSYRLDVAPGYVNSASGFCINGDCLPAWSFVSDYINGNPGYLAGYDSIGTLGSSNMYQSGTKLFIGDIPYILSGSMTNPGYLSIYSVSGSSSSNPMISMGQPGYPDCKIWVNGSSVLESNCSIGMFDTSLSVNPNQLIRADEYGTGLAGSVIYESGSFIGIGTSDPSAKLEVVGQIKITGGSPGIGKVLTSDASGLASWQSPGSLSFTGVASFNSRTGVVIGASGDYSAGQISNTAAGNIAATNVQAALNELDTEKQITITGAATSVTLANLSPNAALVSDLSGKIGASATISSTELGYLDAVTSSVQDQLDAKEPTITSGLASQYYRGDKSWQTLNTAAVPESGNLYFSNARVWSALSGAISEYLTGNMIVNRAIISDPSGKIDASSTISTTELGYLDNTTSNIQGQLDDLTLNKADLASPALTGVPTAPTAIAGTSTTQIATTSFVNTAISPAALAGKVWTLSGNSIGVNDFFGTTNNQDLIFRTNNTEKFRVTSNGNILGFGISSISANNSLVLGYSGGNSMIGSYNAAIGGTNAGYNMSGTYNVVMGGLAAGNSMKGINNTAIGGSNAGFNMNGSYNLGLGGAYAGGDMSGSFNTVLGGYGGGNNMSGSYNVLVGGWSAGYGLNGRLNTAIGGNFPGQFMSGTYNVAIGSYAGSGMTTGENNVYIGTSAIGNAGQSNQFSLGNVIYGSGMGATGMTNGMVGIGTMTPAAKLQVVGTTRLDLGSDATGDMFYRSAGGNLSRLALGTAGKILTSSGGIPAWGDAAAITAPVDSVFGRTGSVIGASGDYTAGQITNVAGGTISATNVQAAVTELDTEKAPLASPALTGIPTAPTAASGTNSTQIATTAFVMDQGYLTGFTENDPKVGPLAPGYIPKWNGFFSQLMDSQVYDNGTSVGIGTSTPGSYKLNVNGDAFVSGSLTILDRLYVDSIVNRSVTNLTLSGNLLPDNNAPLAYRNIGSDSSRWNNLYLSGQVTIGGGSPANGKVLVSDSTGLASWQTLPSTVDCTASGSGLQNTCIGSGALQRNTDGSFNVAFGEDAMASNSGGDINAAFGHQALKDNTEGTYNTAIGAGALKLNTTGIQNTAVGANALGDNTFGNNNAAFGEYTMRQFKSGSYNTAIGQNNLWNLHAGSYNISLGNNNDLLNGTGNISIGNNISMTDGSVNQLNIGNWIYGTGGNIGIGQSSGLNDKLTVAGTGSFQGLRILSGASNGYVLMSDASGNARWASIVTGTGWGFSGNVIGDNDFIGSTNGKDLVFKSNDTEGLRLTKSGNLLGLGNYAVGALTNSLAFGSGAGTSMSGNYNSALGGRNAGVYMSGNYNSAIGGRSAGVQMNGSYNSALGGVNAGVQMNGSYNSALGGDTAGFYMSGLYNSALGGSNAGAYMKGSYNSAIGGSSAGSFMSGTYNSAFGGDNPGTGMDGSLNTAIGGSSAGSQMNGIYNIAIGTFAGQSMAGSNNLYIGSYATGAINGSNQFSIGNVIYGTGMGVSGTAIGQIGIGTITPTSKLDVVGTGTFQGLRILSGASNGYVLTSDASGNARWASIVTGTGWGFSGNVIGANDFIGSTNAQALVLKSNNTERLRMDTSGNIVGLGNGALGALTNSLVMGSGAGVSMNGNYNAAIGGGGAGLNMGGSYSSAFGGVNAGFSMNGNYNTAIGGGGAGFSMNGNYNTAIGGGSPGFAMQGSYNSAFGGSNAGWTMSGISNTALGGEGAGLYMNGVENTALGGQYAGLSMSGKHNVAIGTNAGENMTGSNNIYIGTSAIGNATQSNQFSLGNVIYGSGMGTGGLANGRVGIGTITPTSKLDVVGTGTFQGIKILSGATSGYVLTSDASGNARWAASAGNVTSVFGRTGTVVGASGDYTAGQITNVAGGNIAATNVQAALSELDSEKQANITGAASSVTTANLTSDFALVSSSTGKIATSGTVSSTELGYLDNATSNIQTQLNNKISTGSISGSTNYVSKFSSANALTSSQIFDNGTSVGIGTASPGSYRLNVNGNTYIAGDLTLTGRLFVDTIVNRTVTNISVSGGLIPDSAAPLSVRELGTNTTRWNNLYLSGQITIGGGSPGVGKVLVSDANGLATWTSTSSLIAPFNGWTLSGNSVGANDFIGSTNAQDVSIKRNNIEGLRLSQTGTYSANLIKVSDGLTLSGSVTGGGAGIYGPNAGFLYLGLNNTKSMTINSMGYVGVGPLDPSRSFEVSAGSLATLRLNSGNASIWDMYTDYSVNQNIYVAPSTSTGDFIFTGTSVGIGQAPTANERLYVAGTGTFQGIKILSGASNGYVLTSDALGNARWATPTGGNSWSLSGNSVGANDFIGSTNAQDLIMKVNNSQVARFYTGGIINLGLQNNITGNLATVVGYHNSYTGGSAGDTVIGQGNIVSNGWGGGLVVGASNISRGAWGIVVGTSNTSSSTYDNATVFGKSNTVSYHNGIALGVSNTVGAIGDPYWAFAAGAGNIANGNNAYASVVGIYNTGTSSNGYNAAFGNFNNVTASYASAFGQFNTVSASGASAFGHSISNSVIGSTMIGPNDAAKVTILSGGQMGIGTSTPTSKLDVVGTGTFQGLKILSGASDGYVLTSDTVGNARWAPVGSTNWSLSGNAIGANDFIGSTNVQDLTIKTNNTTRFKITGTGGNIIGLNNSPTASTLTNSFVIGNGAGNSLDGSNHIVLGGLNGGYIMGGSSNTAIGGDAAGYLSSGNYNSSLGGQYAGYAMRGSYNTALGGQYTGIGMSGSYNIAIGTYAGSGMTTGQNNVYIGSAAIGNAGQNNQFSIGNVIYGSGMGSGGLTNGMVGIGTMTPGAKLEIAGTIKITGGSPGAGKVLTSDATGLASWQSMSGTSVSSVFGRTGAVVSASGDYTAGQITNVAGGNIAATNLQAAINELDSEKQALITGAATTITTSNLTASSALVSDSNGKITTLTGLSVVELGYVDGTTSNIQTQLNAKEPSFVTGTTTQYYRGDKTWQTLNTVAVTESTNLYFTNARVASALTGAISNTLTGNLGANFALVSDAGGKIAASSTITSTELGYLDNATSNIQTQLNSKVSTGAVNGTTNYISKFNGTNSITDSQVFDNGTSVGIGTATPGSYKLNVNGDTNLSGSLTVLGSLFVDSIVNRNVTNLTISGNILPDSNAPLAYRNIGSNAQRWNNLYLTGQVTIGGGSPGAGKVLTSDANGLATWAAPSSTVWTLSGNAIGSNDFIGSTNSQDVVMKRNNIEGLRLAQTGTYISGSLQVGNSLNATSIPGYTTSLYGPTAGYLVLGINGGTAMTIDYGGNVAVGAMATTKNFEVNAGADLTFRLNSGNASWWDFNTNYAVNKNLYLTPATGTGDFIFTGTSVGIGTAPTSNERLYVAGTGTFQGLKILSGASNGYVLTSDASGNARWAAAAGGGWGLTGNTGTTAGTNFIGTTDSVSLQFKTNSTNSMILTSSGYLGVGPVSVVRAPLEVYDENGIPLLSFGKRGGGFPWTPMWTTVALGQGALMLYTGSTYNIAVGMSALSATSAGDNNIGIGHDALKFTSGDHNIGIGSSALSFNTAGSDNVAMGHIALQNNGTGISNVAIGSYVLSSSVGSSYNSALGNYALFSNTTGSSNVAFGSGAGYNITTGSNNIAIGSNTNLPSATASNQLNIGNWIYGSSGNIGIGQSASLTDRLVVAGTGSFQGLKILSGASNGYVLTSDASGNARWAVATAPSNLWTLSGNTVGANDFIGSTNAVDVVFKANNTEGLRLTKSGNLVGLGVTLIGSSVGSLAIGENAGTNMGGTRNIAFGGNDAGNGVQGNYNISIGGDMVGRWMRGNYNSAIGGSLAGHNMVGSYNSAFGGDDTGSAMSGTINTALGGQNAGALMDGSYNTAVGGRNVGRYMGGSYNSAFGGEYAGQYMSGTNNVYIGSYATGVTLGSNQFSIGNIIYGTGMGIAGMTNGMVGIGTMTPTSKLDVVGTGTFQGLKILSGASNGYVLTSDASGNARWASASSSADWSLSGNTIGVNDFIGSINAQDVVFKANNVEGLRLTKSGNIIGLGGAGGTAVNSIIVGNGAGSSIAGSDNAALGGQGAGSFMNGSYNSAIGGHYAGISMTGSYNSALGGVSAGNYMNGVYNIAIGTSAGQYMSGSNNVYIGSYATGVTNGNNQFSIGNVLYGTGMGTGGLANGMVGIGTITPSQKLEVSGNVLATSYMTSSDRSLKENIIPLPDALEKVLSLRGYSFNWKNDGREDIGIIAQEVEAVYPEIVHTDPNTGTKSVEYANLIAPMIEAMREQQNMIDTQQREIDELKSTLKEIQSSLQK